MSTPRSAYTLVELLIFLAITAVVALALAGILIVTVQLQAHQSSAGEVQTESTAVLQQLQYDVQNASLINIPLDTPTTTLSLRMSSPALDPTTVTLASGTLYVQQGASSTQPLTSSRIVISNLSFTRHANPPSHDSLNISFTAAANVATNTKQYFSQVFQTTVTQVAAASFNSNLLPSSTNAYSLGASGGVWNSVNNIIYFNGTNVGIGTAAPLAPLDVSGGDIYVLNTGAGVVIRAAGGSCWRLAVNTSGTLATASVSCSAP